MVPYILMGYLTHCPRSAKDSSPTGTLYLEDNYGAVICEVIIYEDCGGMRHFIYPQGPSVKLQILTDHCWELKG